MPGPAGACRRFLDDVPSPPCSLSVPQREFSAFVQRHLDMLVQAVREDWLPDASADAAPQDFLKQLAGPRFLWQVGQPPLPARRMQCPPAWRSLACDRGAAQPCRIEGNQRHAPSRRGCSSG